MKLGNLLKGWGPSGGGGTDPNVCTLSVADNGDGTGGVATIGNSSADATNTLYGANWTAGILIWSNYGSITGNGTLSLTNQGNYLWYISSTLGGFTSVSRPIYAPLTNHVNPSDALEDQLADAIVFELSQAGMLWTSLFTTEGTVPYRTRYPVYGDDGYYGYEPPAPFPLETLKVAVVASPITRTRLSRGGNGREVVYDIYVDMQRMIEPLDDVTLKKFSRMAEQIHDYFDDGHKVIQQPNGWQPNWQYLATDREQCFYDHTLVSQRIWETRMEVKVRGFKP
jgi:hypothetical protein